MTPLDLINICDAPVDGLDGQPVVSDHIYLTVQKRRAPGECVRLAGRSGPLGRVCTAREVSGGLAVVAVFQRTAVRAFCVSL